MRLWIPPLPMVLAQFAFGLSWVVLFIVARSGDLHGLAFFGWLHILALGAATTVALSVLTHVVPQFTDHNWWNAWIPRIAILMYLAGTWCVIIAIFATSLPALQAGAAVVLLALLLFIVGAMPSLTRAIKDGGTVRAIAYALGATLLFLIAAVVVANALPGQLRSGTALAQVARTHGTFGLIGWLSLLIMGVSTRTLRPMTGVQKRPIFFHIASGAAVLAGVILAALATAFAAYPTAFAGYVLIFIGALIYAMDVAATILQATVPNRTPQLFMLAAACFFVVMSALILSAFFDPRAEHAALFTGIIGWIGNAITGHLHHIGARLLATCYLGEDDDTRPYAFLNARVGIATFVAYEVAAVFGIIGFMRLDAQLIAIAALCGLASFVAIVVQALLAIRRLKVMQAV